jgi:hypothetical protein
LYGLEEFATAVSVWSTSGYAGLRRRGNEQAVTMFLWEKGEEAMAKQTVEYVSAYSTAVQDDCVFVGMDPKNTAEWLRMMAAKIEGGAFHLSGCTVLTRTKDHDFAQTFVRLQFCETKQRARVRKMRGSEEFHLPGCTTAPDVHGNDHFGIHDENEFCRSRGCIKV